MPPADMPFSCIVTFKDPFCFIYMNAYGAEVTVDVPAYSFVRFMGHILHRGGANNLDRDVYRLFLYCCIDASHLPPPNTIYVLRSL